MKTLSVLIPAYNEEATIRSVLDKLAALTSDSAILHGLAMEIVVVNDGSTDSTEAEVESFKKDNQDIILKYLAKPNGGKGSAIRMAIAEASGDIMVVQDADMEYDPKDFSLMLPYILDQEYSVVYGSRFLNYQNKHSYKSFYLGGQLVSKVANILFGLHLTDEPTCYKMFTREVISRIDLKCTGFEFCPEFTAKAARLGYSIIEVPIHYYPRSIAEGKKISWKDGVIAVWTLVKYRIAK